MKFLVLRLLTAVLNYVKAKTIYVLFLLTVDLGFQSDDIP